MAGTATARTTTARTAWRGIVDLTTIKLEEGSDGFTRSWIMLVPEGQFDHPQWGKLDLTKPVLDKMVKNFDDNARGIDIALDYDHKASEGDSRAPGWIEDMQYRPAAAKAPAGLWARVRWTPIGLADVKNQIYRYVSAEFKGDYKDWVSGKKYQHVLQGATLTNRPFMKQMPAIQLSSRFQKPGQYTKADREKIADEDFAGPNKTFPIVTQQDVHDAARLIGHAANPAAVKARITAIAKRKGFTLPDAWANDGDGTSAASERMMAVATRKSRKLAEEQEPVSDEQEIEQPSEEETEDALDVLGDDGENEDEDESDELDDGEEDETQELADKPPFKGAAKPFGKGGKKPAANAEDDAEDEADGGADEDAEELDDMTSDDEEYDEANADDGEDEEEAPAPKGRGKGKGMPVKKMTEPQLQAEVARLREESQAKDATIRTLREAEFKHSVNQTLAEFTKDIRTDGDDDEFALPRSFKLAYREFMLSEGIKLSEASVSGLNDLVKLALRVGTVPLTSFANQIESGKLSDADDRRPRTTFDDVDQTPAAEQIALSEYKTPLKELARKDPAAVEKIYMRLADARSRKGRPAA